MEKMLNKVSEILELIENYERRKSAVYNEGVEKICESDENSRKITKAAYLRRELGKAQLQRTLTSVPTDLV